MSAIVGIYRAPDKRCQSMVTAWLHGWDRCLWPDGNPRPLLAKQLRSLRKTFGIVEAREFRNYLLWLGVYPVRLRNHP